MLDGEEMRYIYDVIKPSRQNMYRGITGQAAIEDVLTTQSIKSNNADTNGGFWERRNLVRLLKSGGIIAGIDHIQEARDIHDKYLTYSGSGGIANFYQRNSVTTDNATLGGIDFKTATMNLETLHKGTKRIQFNIDPAQLHKLQNAPGITPIIIRMQTITNLSKFLN